VFADSAGDVGYTILGAFPLLPPGPANSGELPLDGTRSANNWRGTVPHELLPQVVNPGEGFVVTANDRPIQTFYPIRLGLGAGGETLRGLRIKQRIREHLDQGKKFRFEDNLQVQNDSVSPMIKLLLRSRPHCSPKSRSSWPGGFPTPGQPPSTSTATSPISGARRPCTIALENAWATW
jgi:penicillin amidase